jgi:hypothetical protein
MHEQVFASVLKSKKKDDCRGKAIVGDYEFVNTLAGNDLFIKDLRKKTAALKKDVAGMIPSLK